VSTDYGLNGPGQKYRQLMLQIWAGDSRQCCYSTKFILKKDWQCTGFCFQLVSIASLPFVFSSASVFVNLYKLWGLAAVFFFLASFRTLATKRKASGNSRVKGFLGKTYKKSPYVEEKNVKIRQILDSEFL
jgi:hypothetical protein